MEGSNDVAVLLPSQSSPLDCATCRNIKKLFYDPDNADTVNLGSFKNALSDPCAGHKSLVQAFVGNCRESYIKTESEDMGLHPGRGNRSVQIVQSVSNAGAYWNLLLGNIASQQNHPGTGRILDPDWVDLEILRRWKHDCLTLHGKTCHNPMKMWHVRPAWLIDVKKRCLVQGDQPGAFVALSYTYGEYRGMNIDAGMLAALQEPMALDKPEIAQLVPPIIDHAIYLTSFIGELYLWADSLCVPHHDPEATQKELKMMGAIYASAIVTIVAADDDAKVGIRGLRGISKSRQMQQKVFQFGNEQLMVRNTGIFSLSGWLPYYDRGWTFQEFMMSSRQIIFNHKEIHWQCSCSVWHEELVYGAEVDKYINPRLNLILSGFPDLSALTHTICEYNTKTLRDEEDALPGVSGLLSVLSRSFRGGFLYGTPIMFFDRMLGWNPLWTHVNLQRRTRSKRPSDKRLTPSGLPSWSWIGWRGLVSGADSEAMGINNRLPQIEETIPITEWYTGPSPKTPSSERQRIMSTWFENRESSKDPSKPLPPGWTRHDAPKTGNFREEPFLHPDGCDRFIYKHHAMPLDRDAYEGWYYPFPVAEINDTTLPCMPEQTEYLFCDTIKVTLWGRQAGDGNAASLVNSQGKVVGALGLHNEDFLAQFPSGPSTESLGLQVDLVAIYKSRTYKRTWNDKEERYGLPITKEDDYVVLWVEWIDGVAYRLACGQVEAEAWDDLPHENISLVLG